MRRKVYVCKNRQRGMQNRLLRLEEGVTELLMRGVLHIMLKIRRLRKSNKHPLQTISIVLMFLLRSKIINISHLEIISAGIIAAATMRVI